MRNLRAEGFGSRPVTFAKGRRQEVYLSGDIMLDNSLHYATVSAAHTDIIARNGLQKAGYILATIHREATRMIPFGSRLSSELSLRWQRAARYGSCCLCIPAQRN